jgi:tryptophan synthase alpha chain
MNKDFWDTFKKTKPTIVYLTVGFPTYSESVEIAKFLVSNGYAQIIEAGIPFSDPIADGEVIQYSTQVALKNGIMIDDVAKFIEEVKSFRDIPVFAMGYYNPIYANLERNLEKLKKSGAHGLIIPDINVEEIEAISPLLKEYGLLICGFVAPNTNEKRMKEIVRKTTGFIYLVSSYGTTGMRDYLNWESLRNIVQKVKGIENVPVAIGFGIKNAEMIRKAKEISDGAIIGSAVINAIKNSPSNYFSEIEKIFK